jgi:MFS family permease
MSKGSPGNDVFRQLEMQNPAVAMAFRKFRWHDVQYKLADVRPRIILRSAEFGEARRHSVWLVLIALGLLLIGTVALMTAIGPAVVRFLAIYWQVVLLPTAGVFVGAGIVLLVIRVGASPLRAVAPPKAQTDDPLHELKELAERSASRLRAAYRLQLWTVLAVGAVFIALIVWSMVLVSQERILYASAFGSGSVAMTILARWKWQPFDRINQARKLADDADHLATGLRLRMTTILEISDPSKRSKAQWDAVKEYLDRS